MKTSTLAVALATLVSLAAANPIEKRFDVSVTFYGDNGQNYSMLFPTTTNPVTINNDLVVNKLYTNGGGFCTMTGETDSFVLYGEMTKVVDPPQKFKWGSCDNA